MGNNTGQRFNRLRRCKTTRVGEAGVFIHQLESVIAKAVTSGMADSPVHFCLQ